MKTIIAAALALVIATPSFAGQAYEYRRNIFGTYTTYAGTTTEADVYEYIDDVKDAVLEALEATGAAEVIYIPSYGGVVIKATSENWNIDAVEVMEIFRNYNVYLEHVAYTYGDSDVVRRIQRFRSNHEGKVRYEALRHIAVEIPNVTEYN